MQYIYAPLSIGIPDQRPLQEGDIVNLDISCYFEGFHGDTNATYSVGKVDEAGEKLIKAARECLELAIAEGMIPEQIQTRSGCLS
jgi:methionine aminopeptidase